MIEDKEREIAKLLKENRDLHRSLEAKPPVSHLANPLIATFIHLFSIYSKIVVQAPYWGPC